MVASVVRCVERIEDQEKTRAIRNAAAAARPPIRAVCKALRNGRVPVNRPLM